MNLVSCYRTNWISNPLSNIDLNLNTISLFEFNPNNYTEYINNLISILDNDEIKRANKYYFKKDSTQFITSRAFLKLIIAKYAGIKPKQVNILYDSYKKPYLEENSNLFFNVSHSDNCALIAVNNKKIGVDVEYIKTNFDFEDILNYSFNKEEIQFVMESTDSLASFYELWTRKEALLKAIGKGLDETLIKLSVLDGNNSANEIIKSNFNVFSFQPSKYHLAALAVENKLDTPKDLRMYYLPDSYTELMKYLSPKTK